MRLQGGGNKQRQQTGAGGALQYRRVIASYACRCRQKQVTCDDEWQKHDHRGFIAEEHLSRLNIYDESEQDDVKMVCGDGRTCSAEEAGAA